MIDWRRGGWTGSLNKYASREVREHMAANPAVAQSRPPLHYRALRGVLAGSRFGRLLAGYACFAIAAVVLCEIAAFAFPEALLWKPGPAEDDAAWLTTMAGFLITAQVGVLGVVSIALALVTFIAQREGSGANVQVYYRESLSLEIVASSVALLLALCLQLFWPIQAGLSFAGVNTAGYNSSLVLLGTHLLWLLVNLWALAHFISTTFGYVHRSTRETVRERFLVAVLAADMRNRIRHFLYNHANLEFRAGTNGQDSAAWFGNWWNRGDAELESTFTRPMVLKDVRMRPLGWVIRRWQARSGADAGTVAHSRALPLGQRSPRVEFPINLDHPMQGRTIWCRRMGGVPLDFLERAVIRLSFRFGQARGEPDKLSFEEILEELADKAAAHIGTLAPVAFETSLDEMVGFHRFLLAVHATHDPHGAPANYAEIGGGWVPPHRQWARNYRRLMERATDRITEEPEFLQSLANVPLSLVVRHDLPLSPAALTGIVDLGPMLVHRLEAWVTRRRETGAVAGASSTPALTGSDRKAYEEVVAYFVGAWATLLQAASSLHGWEGPHASDGEHWRSLTSGWPFVWQHLENTAYHLATAVWNDDEVSSSLYQAALLRWPRTLDSGHDNVADLEHRRLLYPEVLAMNWADALEHSSSLVPNYMPQPSPASLFNRAIKNVHEDVLLLTAALLLSWCASSKPLSALAASTAAGLLNPVEDDDTSSGARTFGALLLDRLRLEMAAGHQDNRYGAKLDDFVTTLGRMRQGLVVPGESFTPSTIQHWGQLNVPLVAVLLASAPKRGDGGVLNQIEELADSSALPEGDVSLRRVINVLRRLSGILAEPSDGLEQMYRTVAPSGDFPMSVSTTRRIVDEAITLIELKRSRKLADAAVDEGRLVKIRSAVETELLSQPNLLSFFRGASIAPAEAAAHGDVVEHSVRGIMKGELVVPPMADLTNLEETIANMVRNNCKARAWRAFVNLERERIIVKARMDEESLWDLFREKAALVGPDPTLLVSAKAEARAIRAFLRRPEAERPKLNVEKGKFDGNTAYIATIEGVDVFAFDLAPGVAGLFSARVLQSVGFGKLADERRVGLVYEAEDDATGRFRITYAPSFRWAKSRNFLFRIKSPET